LEAKDKVDSLILTFTTEKEALKRDYLHSLALEKRKFLNEENLKQFNDALLESKEVFENLSPNIHFIDTTNLTSSEVSIEVTKYILNDMENNYILRKEIK
ncbi:MAG: hypothetical protein PHD03_01655, partial [Bacilli bacterium]|nr:hypothetical protein [Bacilli bacterium]